MAGALAGPVFETPVTLNPLRNFLSATVNFARVRECEELELFITATNVRTGTGKLWERKELDVQKVLASACLPTVFAAVEVDGETYWDGSYVANPPLAPLIERGAARDLVIVQNNPIARQELPRNMADISNRANEIAFNISFVREISALQHLHGVPDELRGARAALDPVRLHLITGNDRLSEYKISAKFNAEPGFLQLLHDLGVSTAETWLREHAQHLGVRSTLDPMPVYFPDRL